MPLTDEQIAIRATGIGASELAAALGLSPWCTPLELFQRKRGELSPPEETRPMRFGNFAEQFILDEFQLAHPDLPLVRAPNTLRRGPLLAHLDAWVPDVCNVQAKTARTRAGWGDSGSNSVPEYYLIQVQAEMLLANVHVSYMPVFFGGSEYDEFVVEADWELQEMIEDGAHSFWRRVQEGEPPEPVSYADVQARWGSKSTANAVTADEQALSAITALRELTALSKELDDKIEFRRAIVMKHLGENDTLIDASGKVLATWKAAKPSLRFDSKTFQLEHADIYDQYLKPSDVSRRFLIK